MSTITITAKPDAQLDEMQIPPDVLSRAILSTLTGLSDANFNRLLATLEKTRALKREAAELICQTTDLENSIRQLR